MNNLDTACEKSESEILLGGFIKKSETGGNYIPRCNFSPLFDVIPDCIEVKSNYTPLGILDESKCIGCKYHSRDHLRRV